MAIELAPGERKIDTWTLYYTPPGGGKVAGKLTVTDQRLLYDAKWDARVLGDLGKRVSSDLLEIRKDEIADVETSKKLLSKKVIVNLTDGTSHVFDYGAMSIDKIVAAIGAR